MCEFRVERGKEVRSDSIKLFEVNGFVKHFTMNTINVEVHVLEIMALLYNLQLLENLSNECMKRVSKNSYMQMCKLLENMFDLTI